MRNLSPPHYGGSVKMRPWRDAELPLTASAQADLRKNVLPLAPEEHRQGSTTTVLQKPMELPSDHCRAGVFHFPVPVSPAGKSARLTIHGSASSSLTLLFLARLHLASQLIKNTA